MAIQTRNSVLAVTVETTEGTPVAPSASTDFIAQQDDFDMTQEFETLDNAELKASLGKAKSIVGLESSTTSFSHYLRHSAVEGQAPSYGDLLKAAFGTETVNGTEYDTVAASTTEVVKVDTGEGATFARGHALLVKDGTNGYSIRPIHSISTDDLTVGFDLANAPASGVNLGKAVTYSPADTGHQTLSLWNYVGNSGAIKMTSGNRVTETTIEIAAGELINASYTCEGIKNYFNPIVIAATDTYLDFTDDDGTFAATITAQTYQDPHALADAIASAMNATATTETHTVTYSDSTGKFTIATSTSAVLSLLWNTGGNAANTVGDKIGFSVAADDTGATTYTSDTAQDWAAAYTPSFDASDPLVAKDNLCMIGDHDDYACFAANSVSFTLGTPKRDTLSICSTSGRSGSIINAREVTISVSALLEQHDADKFRRMRENSDTRFCYVGGTKTGGNWDAGKCFCLYVPTATITSVSTPDDDGLVALELELSAYVDDSGNGEVYLSFV